MYLEIEEKRPSKKKQNGRQEIGNGTKKRNIKIYNFSVDDDEIYALSSLPAGIMRSADMLDTGNRIAKAN